MTAALLGKKLPWTQITVLEASDIPVIGVGESTNMTMKYFLHFLGYDEKRFMQACEASFKRAIRFTNFNHLNGVFYHPFGMPQYDRFHGDFSPDAQTMYKDFDAIEAGNLFSRDCDYSYQIDAGLFAEYLKQECKRQGRVLHVVDRVIGAQLTENGDIESIVTESNGNVIADLYIDCTGFRSVLLGNTLKEPFESYSRSLLNDRAIAVRLPYLDKEKELVTHTNCTALSSGWVWSIPLWSRIGLGYVYSSGFASHTNAEIELRRYLGKERSEGLEYNHIKIRVGRHARAWVKNCVAIGISYGFLEPLESTGLSLTQIAISDLATTLASWQSLSIGKKIYNKRQSELFDSTRDFIIAHYILTAREDTDYWQSIRRDVYIPESLISILTDARARSYQSVLDNPHRFYQKGSWNCILSGMGFFGKEKRQSRPTDISRGETHANTLQRQIFEGHVDMPTASRVFDQTSHPIWYPTW